MSASKLFLHLIFITLLARCAVAAGSSSFVPTGSMTVARSDAVGIMLGDAKVLIAGGTDQKGVPLASAEIYDAHAGTFVATGSMASPRCHAVAVLLQNGSVLIAGGYFIGTLGTAELYDPSTGTFSPTGDLRAPREFATATRLANGKVLVAGGMSSFVSLASAEVYDPAKQEFEATGGLQTGRLRHTATLLRDGKVLIVGGQKRDESRDNDPPLCSPLGGCQAPFVDVLASSEIYDPRSGIFLRGGNMNAGRIDATETLLPDGKVLIAGGANERFDSIASAELYDPRSNRFALVKGKMANSRGSATSVLLRNGTVLVAGGTGSEGLSSRDDAELYSPSSQQFSVAGKLAARKGALLILLPNGDILVAGGVDSENHSVDKAGLYRSSH